VVVFFDTMIAAHLIDESLPKSLEVQAGLMLGVDNWGKGKIDFGIGDKPPTPFKEMGTYCSRDTAYTHMLYDRQKVQLVQDPRMGKLAKHLVLPGVEAIAKMELNGIWLDRERVARRRLEFAEELETLRALALEHVPEPFREKASFTNPHFLRRWLFGAPPDGLGLIPTKFTEKTKEPATDEEAISNLVGQHPAVDNLVKIAKATKALQFLSQWEQWADHASRIHPYFNLTGTVTGRRSCDNPNLQQVPRDKRLRGCFGAPPGWLLLSVDYSAVEVRLAAWIAEEEGLLEVFRRGHDPYVFTAAKVFAPPGPQKDCLHPDWTVDSVEKTWTCVACAILVTGDQRQKAKAIVLGFLYGMGSNGFVVYAKDTFGVVFTETEGALFRAEFFALFPGLESWHLRCKRYVEKYFEAESPLGRVRHLQQVLSFNRVVSAKAVRQAINSPVQGTGGDLCLAATIELTEKLDPEEAFLVGDIHDALLLQVREDKWREVSRTVLETMENPAILRKLNVKVPIRLKADAELGRYWKDGAVAFSLETIDEVQLAS